MTTTTTIPVSLAAALALAGCAEPPPPLSTHRQLLGSTVLPQRQAFECAPTPAGDAEPIGIFADGRDLLRVAGADGCAGTIAARAPDGSPAPILDDPGFYLAASGATLAGRDVVCATRAAATPVLVSVLDDSGAVIAHHARGGTGLLYTITATEVVCRAQAAGGAWGAVAAIDLVPAGAAPAAQWVSGVDVTGGVASAIVLVDSLFDPGRLTTTGRPAHDGFWRAALAVGADGAIALGARALAARPDLRQFACANDVTCAELGVACGDVIGPCGTPLHCGGCPAGATCGGGGEPGVCGEGACVPATCDELGAACGEVGDGCGGILACGACTGGFECGVAAPNQCGCVPRSCETQGKQCGFTDDGCGAPLECGRCAGDPGPAVAGEEPPPAGTCGGGGVANVCGAL
jgi:hypothetical protein